MLPYTFNRVSIYAFIDQVIDENYDSRCGKIVFNFSNLNFIYPAAVTVLSNLIEFLRLSKVKISFIGHSPNQVNSAAISYLDDSGFFKQYLKHSLRDHAVVRSTTLPLELVEYSKSYEYMGFRLIPWLARNLDVDERALSTIKVCFQEIFNNINDHSQVKIGCSFAQYYPQKNELIMTISDFGVGIPYNIRKDIQDITDHEAIEKACEQGYTTQTTGRNRGAGLDILIKNVVLKNGGTLIIQSRHGMMSCLRQNHQLKKVPRAVDGFYPGTLIQLHLNTSQFIYDEFSEDFEW